MTNYMRISTSRTNIARRMLTPVQRVLRISEGCDTYVASPPHAPVCAPSCAVFLVRSVGSVRCPPPHAQNHFGGAVVARHHVWSHHE